MGVYGAQSISQIIGSGNAPTVTLGPVAGTGATYTIVGNNITGRVTVTTGSGLSLNATGVLVTLTLADGVTYPNFAQLQIEPLNAGMAGMLMSRYTTTTNNSVSVNINNLTLNAATPYAFSYLITGV